MHTFKSNRRIEMLTNIYSYNVSVNMLTLRTTLLALFDSTLVGSVPCNLHYIVVKCSYIYFIDLKLNGNYIKILTNNINVEM